MTEVRFWEAKCMNLESLFEQMKAPTTRKMASILDVTDRLTQLRINLDSNYNLIKFCFYCLNIISNLLNILAHTILAFDPCSGM